MISRITIIDCNARSVHQFSALFENSWRGEILQGLDRFLMTFSWHWCFHFTNAEIVGGRLLGRTSWPCQVQQCRWGTWKTCAGHQGQVPAGFSCILIIKIQDKVSAVLRSFWKGNWFLIQFKVTWIQSDRIVVSVATLRVESRY